MPKPLNRRTLLRAAGASIALPLLDAMLPRSLARPSGYRPAANSATVAPRFVCCYVPQGVNEAEWFPETTGRDYALPSSLRPLSELKSRFTLVSGLGHPGNFGQHEGADVWLTAADLRATPGRDYQNSHSIDQLVAETHRGRTRFPSLQLSAYEGTGQPFTTRTLSFDRRGNPLPADSNPRRVFDRLFVPENASSKRATLRRYEQRQSVLDLVRSEAKSLERTLGPTDRQKLDEYFTSLRDTERRIETETAWVGRPKPNVTAEGLLLDARPGNRHDRRMWLDVMLDLTHLALCTDTTRVVSFLWDTEPGGLGAGDKNHHELSHHHGDPNMLRGLAEIDRFYVDRLTRFLKLLEATHEADGTMLSNTVVLYGSGMSNGATGGHSPKNVPLLVAGGEALGLRHAGHLNRRIDSTPMSNLLLTLARTTRPDLDHFADSTGSFDFEQ